MCVCARARAHVRVFGWVGWWFACVSVYSVSYHVVTDFWIIFYKSFEARGVL